jgi:hypothetical protein
MAVLRKQRPSLILRLATTGFLVIALFFLSRGVWRIHEKSVSAGLEARDMERRLAELKQREVFLQGALLRLSTSEGVEQEIRSQFNVKRPGEAVAVIVTDKTTVKATSSIPSFWSNPALWFKKIFVR